MEVVVGVGVHDAGEPVAEVQHLEPAEDGVLPAAGIEIGGGGREDLLQRMHLDHVHEAEHLLEARVGFPVGVTVAEHLHEVRMVHLHHLVGGVVPEGEPLDLGHGIVVVDGRAAAVLLARPLHEGKRILVVHRQERPGELHAAAGGHQVAGPQTLEVGRVARDPVVLGAGAKLDVLGEQVLDATELTRGVVARGSGVAVEVAADPAAGGHDA